jgi:hypothetical protein
LGEKRRFTISVPLTNTYKALLDLPASHISTMVYSLEISNFFGRPQVRLLSALGSGYVQTRRWLQNAKYQFPARSTGINTFGNGFEGNTVFVHPFYPLNQIFQALFWESVSP